MKYYSKGYSLVEVVVAMVVLSIGILGVMKLNMTNVFSLKNSWEIENRVLWLQNIMEEMIATPFENVDNKCDSLSGSIEILGESYMVTCRIIEYSSDLKQIFISLSGRGGVYSFSIYRAPGV